MSTKAPQKSKQAMKADIAAVKAKTAATAAKIKSVKADIAAVKATKAPAVKSKPVKASEPKLAAVAPKRGSRDWVLAEVVRLDDSVRESISAVAEAKSIVAALETMLKTESRKLAALRKVLTK